MSNIFASYGCQLIESYFKTKRYQILNKPESKLNERCFKLISITPPLKTDLYLKKISNNVLYLLLF